MTYLQRQSTRRAPQSAPIPGSTRYVTAHGGFAWAVDDWTRLRRFLDPRLGGRQLLRRRVGADARERRGGRALPRGRRRCAPSRRSSRSARQAGRRRTTRRCSRSRWRPALGDEATRRAALEALPRVCRTSTHLFQFATFVEGFRGWGRALRRAVGGWYAARSPESLAYQAVKYRQRDGMTHRDLLRLAHPAGRVGAGNPTLELGDEHRRLFEWIVAWWQRPTACRGSSRASRSPSRRRRRRARPTSSASTACRARRSRAST